METEPRAAKALLHRADLQLVDVFMLEHALHCVPRLHSRSKNLKLSMASKPNRRRNESPANTREKVTQEKSKCVLSGLHP